jgi:hypothetical protein
MRSPGYLWNCGLGPHVPGVSDTFLSLSHNLQDLPPTTKEYFASWRISYLGLGTELRYLLRPFVPVLLDHSDLEWISSPRALVAWYLGATQQGGGTRLPQRKGLPGTSPGWNYPRWAPRLLLIRSLKATGVAIEDTGAENCLRKAKFISTKGCAGTWAQQAQGADHRSSFLFLTQWALPLYSDWLSLGAQSAQDCLMLHLEFGGGVSSNFTLKTELSEQEPRAASS